MPTNDTLITTFNDTLSRYRAAKASTDSRITAAEDWWRLRNTGLEAATHTLAADGGHHSASAWLHNVIVNKHADAVEAYPEPTVLPREEADIPEAQTLCAILPCILEENHFEATWSDLAWQKLKTGTSACKVVWDPTLHGGLGDIAIRRVDLRDIYFEPGVRDIQDSRYLFHIEWLDRETLLAAHPHLATADLRSPLSAPGVGDDRLPVVEVYYKTRVGGRQTLQHCRYVGRHILSHTASDEELAARGLYDHGLYPYVLDPLFPLEGTPCGYGFVDLCRGAQTEIDLLKTAFVRNAMVGATPRYFSRGDGIDEGEFLDLSRPLVHVGNASEDTLRRIEHDTLSGTYIDLYDRAVKELRETSGNTETGSGNVTSGVTAAAAIAALQEASGKGGRDASAASYRAYARIIELCIELLRQFYTLPRRFRITGEDGAYRFVSWAADGLRPGQDEDGLPRTPVFDIRVLPRRRAAWNAAARNELTLDLFRLGFFDPTRREEARTALSLLDFEGKESLMRQWEAAVGGDGA